MKYSGIEWIGEIPESWKINKFKHLYIASNAGEVIDKGFWNVGEELLYTCQRTPMKSNYTDFPEEKRTTTNDLLLTRNATPYIFKPEPNAIYSNVVQRVTIQKGGCIPFIQYAAQEAVSRVIAQGDTIPSYNMQIWDNIVIPYPLSDEQSLIAAYLDRQCALIDSVIEKTKASIEEYKKLRQAVITQAVTKGVRGERAMKDSGIEWIGEIPEEWDAVRLKFLLSQIIDCPHETPIYSFDGEYFVIRTADEDYGFLRPDENMYRLNVNEYKNRIRRLSLNKDDIVYGREGERWGLACIVPESNKYCLGQRMMQFRCKTDIVYPLFLKWALNSWNVYIQGCFDTLGSTSPHVNISTIINYYIPIPSYEEQIELAEYMESKSISINALITKKEQFLTELESYKKSLIYEYVTGKKEVPQA